MPEQTNQEATLVTRLGGKVFGLLSKRRVAAGADGKAAAAPSPQPPLAATHVEAEAEAPQPEASASTQPSAPGMEPSGRSSLAPHALDGLPSEVGRTSCRRLAAGYLAPQMIDPSHDPHPNPTAGLLHL